VDIIYLHGLKVECVIGVWEWERRIKQLLVIDVDMAADVATAAASDQLDATLNYKAVAKRLIDYVGASEFHLIETVAEKVAQLLIDEFKIKWCRVKIDKGGAVRGTRNVGILIERGERT